MSSTADAGRLIHLAKKRERQKEDIEKQKKKIIDETQNISGIREKFTAHYDAIEQTLKSDTVGLVTFDEMKAKQQDFVAQRENQLSHRNFDSELQKIEETENEAERQRRLAEGQKRRMLSFDPDEEVEKDDDAKHCQLPNKIKKMCKNPTVDTSFLPDQQREKEENRLREELRLEWIDEQTRQKQTEINLAFSYWDGSGHRRDTLVKKGSTIGQFLIKAIELLKKDFSELRSVGSESLMFIKEDLIIPHYHTFQDFIVTKAMGKTGPLFEFDAAAELRLRHDAALDTSDSHPAKVVLRSWYEKNKHIYPSSRWEPFVPNKKYRQTFDDLSTI